MLTQFVDMVHCAMFTGSKEAAVEASAVSCLAIHLFILRPWQPPQNGGKVWVVCFSHVFSLFFPCILAEAFLGVYIFFLPSVWFFWFEFWHTVFISLGWNWAFLRSALGTGTAVIQIKLEVSHHKVAFCTCPKRQSEMLKHCFGRNDSVYHPCLREVGI